jgi:quercetin dioxygenase-like cupin family protein
MRLLRVPAKRAFALCLLAGAQLAAQNKRPAFENDQVLIEEPHGQPHDHKLNRVMIYLQAGGETLHYLDGHDVVLKWGDHDIKWSPASGMHTSEITNANPVHLIDVGIKKPGDPGKVASTALDALRVDPNDYKLEFENSQVRVVRVGIGPRQSVPMHEHVLNHVVVYFTEQNVRETSPEGRAEVAQHQAGEFSWSGPCKHRVENLTDQPFEAVFVELKN